MYIGTMYIDTTETKVVYTMHSTTSRTPNKRIETVLPQIFNIGPYAIKYTGQQRVLFRPSLSLKRVEISVQINISVIKPASSPLLSTSYTGWPAGCTD